MRILESRPALRWLAPAAFLLVVSGTGVAAVTATAERRLPARSAEQLLVDLQGAEVDGLSGRVVQTSNLGIPEIPGASADSAELQSLVSGTHSLRVWYAGQDKARLALEGTFAETNVIKNGKDLWVWSSEENEATHTTITPGDKPSGQGPTPEQRAQLPQTPQEAAEQLLAAVGPTTTVSTDSDVTVAGRSAYELVLIPKDERSLIRQVRLAVDGEEFVPLRAQVFAQGAEPAFEVSYTSVDFEVPDAAQFAFNPPPGATVTEVEPPSDADRDQARDKARDKAGEQGDDDDNTVVGEGWTTVVVADTEAATADTSADSGEFGAFLKQLPRVSGDWGSGRLLEGTAFTVVLTDDGRIAAGAVQPELVYEALDK